MDAGFNPIDTRRPRGRHISDDVTSLDSWSDLNDRESRHRNSTDGHESSALSKELFLSPCRLQVLAEPPEAKMVKVKLQKSDSSQGPHRRNKFFQVSIPSGSKESPWQHKMKKQTHRHMSIEDAEDDNTFIHERSNKVHAISEHISQQSEHCDCNDCIETTTLETTPYRASKPSYIKQNKNPLQMRNRLKERSENTSDPNDIEQTEKVKNKLMSVWNNVKYGKKYLFKLKELK